MGLLLRRFTIIDDNISLSIFINLLNDKLIINGKEKEAGKYIFKYCSQFYNKNNYSSYISYCLNKLNDLGLIYEIEDIELYLEKIWSLYSTNDVKELMEKLANTYFVDSTIEGWIKSYCRNIRLTENKIDLYKPVFKEYFINSSSSRFNSDILNKIHYKIMIKALNKKLNKVTYDSNRTLSTGGANNESSVTREDNNDFKLTESEIHKLLAWSKVLDQKKGESLYKFVADLVLLTLEKKSFLSDTRIKVVKFYSVLGGSYISYLKSYLKCIDSYSRFLKNPNMSQVELNKVIVSELSDEKFTEYSKPNCRVDLGGSEVIWDKKLELIKSVLPIFNKIINESIERNTLLMVDYEILHKNVSVITNKEINMSKLVQTKKDDMVLEILNSINNESEIKFDSIVKDKSVLPFVYRSEDEEIEDSINLNLFSLPRPIMDKYRFLYMRMYTDKSQISRVSTGISDTFNIEVNISKKSLKEDYENKLIQRLNYIENGIPMAKTIRKSDRMGLPKKSVEDVMFSDDIPSLLDLNKEELAHSTLYEKYLALTSVYYDTKVVKNSVPLLQPVGLPEEGSYTALTNADLSNQFMNYMDSMTLGISNVPFNVSRIRLETLNKFIIVNNNSLNEINSMYNIVAKALPNSSSIIGDIQEDTIETCKNSDYASRLVFDYAKYLTIKNNDEVSLNKNIPYMFNAIKPLFFDMEDANFIPLDILEYYELYCENMLMEGKSVPTANDFLNKDIFKDRLLESIKSSEFFQLMYGDSIESFVSTKILAGKVSQAIYDKLIKPLILINNSYNNSLQKDNYYINKGLKNRVNLGLDSGIDKYTYYKLWSDVEDTLSLFDKLPETINSSRELSNLFNIRINKLFTNDEKYSSEMLKMKILNDIGLDSIKIIDNFVRNNTETIRVMNTHYILNEEDIIGIPLNGELLELTSEQEDDLFNKFLSSSFKKGCLIHLLLVEGSKLKERFLEENKSPILKLVIDRLSVIYDICVTLGYDFSNKDEVLVDDLIEAYVNGSRKSSKYSQVDLDRICKVVYNKIYSIIKIANKSLDSMGSYCRFRSTRVDTINYKSIEDNLQVLINSKTFISSDDARNIFLNYYKKHGDRLYIGSNNLLYNRDNTIFTVKIEGNIYGVYRQGFYIPESSSSDKLYPILLTSYPIEKAREEYLNC